MQILQPEGPLPLSRETSFCSPLAFESQWSEGVSTSPEHLENQQLLLDICPRWGLSNWLQSKIK